MMTGMNEAQNYLDLNSLNSIRVGAKSDDKESKEVALEQAAKQFEAIFMQMLMKSMRKAQEVLESDSPFNSQSTKFYRDMHDQQMSLELSNNGSLGLSELIVRQLGGDSENFKSHNVVRFDGDINSRKQTNNANTVNVTGKEGNNLTVNASQNRQANDSTNFSITSSMQKPSFDSPKDFVTALTADAKRVQEK